MTVLLCTLVTVPCCAVDTAAALTGVDCWTEGEHDVTIDTLRSVSLPVAPCFASDTRGTTEVAVGTVGCFDPASLVCCCFTFAHTLVGVEGFDLLLAPPLLVGVVTPPFLVGVVMTPRVGLAVLVGRVFASLIGLGLAGFAKAFASVGAAKLPSDLLVAFFTG